MLHLLAERIGQKLTEVILLSLAVFGMQFCVTYAIGLLLLLITFIYLEKTYNLDSEYFLA